jgi:hypothetical protein
LSPGCTPPLSSIRGELVLDLALDRPSERAGAELRIEALPGEEPDGLVGELDVDPLCPEPSRQPVEQERRDLDQLLVGKRTEDDDLVDPVDELGPEALAEDLHQLVLQLLEVAACSGVVLDAVGAEVRVGGAQEPVEAGEREEATVATRAWPRRRVATASLELALGGSGVREARTGFEPVYEALQASA